MAHRNARLTLHARRLLVVRVAAGWPAARVAEQLGVSRATVYKWVRRHRDDGDTGLLDRSSRPHHCPTRTPTEVENQILALRRRYHRGPVFLASSAFMMNRAAEQNEGLTFRDIKDVRPDAA